MAIEGYVPEFQNSAVVNLKKFIFQWKIAVDRPISSIEGGFVWPI